jgi:hypothetical protein
VNQRSYYQQVTVADGWAYVQTAGLEDGQVIVFPVAAWAFKGNRKVIGLISQPEPRPPSKVPGILCTPLEPPILPGEYKPIAELSEAEMTSLRTGKPVHAPAPASPPRFVAAPPNASIA